MFREERRSEVWDELRQHDLRTFANWLTPAVFAETARRSGVAVGQSTLSVVNLVWLGIAGAWYSTVSFASLLTITLKLLQDQQDFEQSSLGRARREGQQRAQRRKSSGQWRKGRKRRGKKTARPTARKGVPPRRTRSRHDPRRDDPTQVSEEAFVKARRRMPLAFWVNLILVLGEHFAAEHGPRHQFRGFRLLAIDGTRIDLPNVAALRKHYGTARNKSGTHQVQAQMVLMQFPFTRMPYRYEFAPIRFGEVTLALRLAPHLQADDLVLLDAGYWSYHLLWTIVRQRAFFAIRLRKDVKLVKQRWGTNTPDDYRVRWTPKDSRGKWRALNLPPSIDLRIVHYRVPGFRPTALITNVLDPRRLSREDWTRLNTDHEAVAKKFVPGLYYRRWEIETTIRELKVEQGLDRSLRSHTVKSIEFEVAGHITLYLLTRWLMLESAIKHHLDPLRLSFRHALEELTQIRPALLTATPEWAATVLLPRLLDRIAEHQVPERPGRHYPRRKTDKHQTRRRKTRKSKCNSKVPKQG